MSILVVAGAYHQMLVVGEIIGRYACAGYREEQIEPGELVATLCRGRVQQVGQGQNESQVSDALNLGRSLAPNRRIELKDGERYGDYLDGPRQPARQMPGGRLTVVFREYFVYVYLFSLG